MTREEAIKMLTAKVECMKRDISGSDEECNSHRCGECNLCYEQGNMGEQVEYLQMAIKALEEPQWIPCSERLPECEQEVLICTEKKLVGRNAYIDPIITPAMYEDGTMRENDSSWRWEDVDWAGWGDEEDCGIIPEGWWENRHFNQDEVYNNPVDQKVVAWMPLPEPWRGDEK